MFLLRRDSGSGRISTAGEQTVQQPAPEIASSSASVTAVQPAVKPSYTKYVITGAAALLAAIGFALYHFKGAATAPSGPAKVTQVSHWHKPIEGAVLSPDGRTFAFTSPISGFDQVLVMLTSGGEPLQLTRDASNKRICNFSTDGTEIYFAQTFGTDEVWAVPTLGGSTRRIAEGAYLAPSVDGSYFFYQKSSGDALFRAPRSGNEERLIYRVQGTGRLYNYGFLVYPDGKDLLFGLYNGARHNFAPTTRHQYASCERLG